MTLRYRRQWTRDQHPHLTGEPAASARGLQPLRRGPAAHRGAAARGRRCVRGAGRRARRGAGRRAARVGPARERASAAAAHPRSLRRADRRGRVPPGVAPAARARSRMGPARPAVARDRPRRARRPGRRLHPARPGRVGRRLPALDDVRRGAGAARGACTRCRVGAAVDLAQLRGWRTLRDGR